MYKSLINFKHKYAYEPPQLSELHGKVSCHNFFSSSQKKKYYVHLFSNNYLHQGSIVFMTVCLAVCLLAQLYKYYLLDLPPKNHKMGLVLTVVIFSTMEYKTGINDIF